MKKRFLLFLLAIAVVLSMAACSTSDTNQVSNTDANETVDAADDDTTNSNIIEISDLLTCPTFTAEKNSSAMVDQIALTAKEYADSLTDDQAAEIVSIIREADHGFYNGPEEMEKFMWYGYLLDYKYDDPDPRSELGADLCQAIKYVYRNVETVLDDATHENLLQIDKTLSTIQ